MKMGYLKVADRRDMDILFDWVNEASVRENAFSESKISYEEHKKWFESILKSKDAKQYIYICDEMPIGQVRVDIYGEKAEIDYSICLEKRHMGYGKEMIAQLKQQMRFDFPCVKTLVAKVKPENAASQKVFLENGYKEIYHCFELEIGQTVQEI